jgi:hypothetical protein
MIPTLQKITIIVLALLQLAAPLVHAHGQTETVGTGLHVPGLESLAIGNDVNGVSSLITPQHSENFLLDISTGIECKSSTDLDSVPPLLFFLITLLVVISKVKPVFVSTPNPHLSSRGQNCARPECRAPPAVFSS